MPFIALRGRSRGATSAQGAPAGLSLTLPAIASAAVLRAPTVAYRVSAPTIAAGSTVRTPAVAYRVTAPTIAAGAVLRTPSLIARVQLPAVAAAAVLSPPTVALSGGPLALSLPFLAAAAVLRAPSVALRAALPTIASAIVTRAPALRYALQAPTVPAAAVLRAPTLIPEFLIVPPSVGATATLFAPDVSGGTVSPPLDPPVITQWREPLRRTLVVHGMRAYGIRLGVGTVPAGATKVVTVTISGLTDREAWFVQGIATTPIGVYLRDVWMTVPGTLAFVYVNRTGVDRFVDYHDTTLLVMQRTGPVP